MEHLPDLGNKLDVLRVANVILANVAVEPIADEEEAIIHGDEDVSDEGGHDRQYPSLDLKSLSLLSSGPCPCCLSIASPALLSLIGNLIGTVESLIPPER